MKDMNYRVIIAGCRNFDDYALLKERCNDYLCEKMETHNVIIVSGHASGADALGERFAEEFGLQCEIHPADWAKYGRSAGPIRNAEMASCSDALIAFWDGQNPGTRSMIELARKKGLQVAVVYFTDKE